MSRTPAPYPALRSVTIEGDDPIDDLRREVHELGERLDARIDRLEDIQASSLKLSVEAIETAADAIKAANEASAASTRKWITIATTIITTLGTIAAAYLKYGSAQ